MRNVFRAIVIGTLGVTFLGLAAAPVVAQQQEAATEPSGKILVLPFNGLNPSQYQGWLGRSIQQSLVADLTALAPGRVESADVQATDAHAAAAAGQKQGARYVVFGSFATADHDLRLTGEVLDVSTEKSVAPLKATGNVQDVFHLEDMLAAEIRQPLALAPTQPEQGQTPVANGPYPEPTTGVTVQPSAPGEYYSTYVNPPSTTYYNNYYYNNPYPYDVYSGYDYGFYPWYGLGFGFVTPFYGGEGFHHRFHEHDRDFDRDEHGIRFGNFGAAGLNHTPYTRAYGSAARVGSGVYQPGGLSIAPGASGLRIQGFGGGHFGGSHFGGSRGGGFGGAHFGGGGAHAGGGGHR